MLKKLMAGKIPIFIKLFVITFFGMVAAILYIVNSSTGLFESKFIIREGDVRMDQARVLSEEIETKIRSLIDKTKIVGGILYREYPNESDRESALEIPFQSDRDLVAVSIYTWKDGKFTLVRRTINTGFLKESDLKPEFIDGVREARPFLFARPFNGEYEIQNSSTAGGAQIFSIGIPLVRDDNNHRVTHIALADVKMEKIQSSFSDVTESTNYLINREGGVLAHSNDKLAAAGKKLDNIPIVQWAITSKDTKTFQKPFVDPESNEEMIGAYAKKPEYGITVISQVPTDSIRALSNQVKKLALRTMFIVLSLMFFFIVTFSLTLTTPIEKLVEATVEIAKGNFGFKPNVHTRDEVGELAVAFDSMIEGLKERDKVKSTFAKLHGAGVADTLLSGDLTLGGQQKDATVFFCDIRGFTAFSEKQTPQGVVDMLNEYFKIMVSVIQKNHGMVDKFIGDAIMAVWGAPKSHGNDAVNAIKACVEMRLALAELNKHRLSRGDSEIKIGMGLHSGPLIAGTIGSDDRMEYTVIGDTVNQASRIEAATKAFGTDMLISEATQEKIKDHFVLELAGNIEAKGKSEAFKVFKVKGYIDAEGKQVLVSTKYSDYEAEAADKIKIA